MKNRIIFKSISKIIGIFLLVVSIGLNTLDGTGAWFTSSLGAENNEVQTGDWVPPTVPNWLKPHDGVYTHQSQNILIDWTDSVDDVSGLAGYEYENTWVETSTTWNSKTSCGLIIQSQIPNSQVGPGSSCIDAPAGTLSNDGTYQRRVRAYDNDGNISDWSLSWTIIRDTVEPTSLVNLFVPNSTTNLTFNVNYTATDDRAGVKQVELFYRKDGGAWTSYGKFISSLISFTASGSGNYDFYTIAEDRSDDLDAAQMAAGVGDNGIGNLETKTPQVEATMTVVLPAPNLVYPLNNTTAVVGSSWLANPYMDWADVVWPTTIWYRYESSHTNTTNPDGSFTSPVYVSGLLTNSFIPAPGTPNGIYYWHVRAYDGTNWSSWSETWTLTVDRTIQQANSGNVVMNELMWMGSTSSTADEWIELRNMTGSPITLKNWVIENGGDGSPNLVIPAGLTIPANGYFLIANYSASDPSSSLAVSANWVTTGVELLDTDEQLTLKDAIGNTIDQTPATDDSWAAGINGALEQSMERNDVPSDGTLSTSWHTCTNDACNNVTYWDAEGNNYGTPKAANLSEGDPTSPDYLQTDLDFYLRADRRAVGFKVTGISPYENLKYEIAYSPTNREPQGITGEINLSGGDEVGRGDLILGTCSAGGTCIYDSGMPTIHLKVILTGSGVADRVLEKDLDY